MAHGRRAFDVVATLGPGEGGAMPTADLPSTNAFTLVLDADVRRVIIGGAGQGAVVPVTSTDGRRFHVPKFSVGVMGSSCSGPTAFNYSSFDFTVSGSTLHGTAEGAVEVSCGDCEFNVSFTAAVAGTADVTPPLLFATSGVVPADPFEAFSVTTSEPLPTTATARLLASDGSHVDLEPTIVPGDLPLVIGFSKPNVVLPYGKGFVVAVDGLVDFAGLRGSADTPLRLTAFETPPLLLEDGFESAPAGQQLGGATVISSGGALPPITDTRSVYIGAQGAPAPGGIAVGAALRVRLLAQPGDTVLRFSYRIVSRVPGVPFGGNVALGSVGRSVAESRSIIPAPDSMQTMTSADGSSVALSVVSTMEIALPADITDELVVAFETSSSGCGLPLPHAGLLIDDLRVE
jgi:hypothetical protein